MSRIFTSLVILALSFLVFNILLGLRTGDYNGEFDRVQKPLQKITHTVAQDGHVLVVAHRNVNKMLVQSLLGLDFGAGYRVEHLNHWLYIFTLQSKEIYLMELNSPADTVEINPGYCEID